MLVLPNQFISRNIARNFSNPIKFTDQSAENIAKLPFFQNFLSNVKQENFARQYSEHLNEKKKAHENLKLIQEAPKSLLISALFMTKFDPSFLKLENHNNFPLCELVDRVAENLRQSKDRE